MSAAPVTTDATRRDRPPSARAPFLQRPAVVATVFLAPFIVLYVVFRVWAIGHAVSLSFQDIQGIGASEWTGLSNYRMLLTDRAFYGALRNTALYTIGTLLVLIPFPFVLAALLHSGVVKRSNSFRTVFFLPVLTSLVVVSVVFSLLLSTDGLFNQALSLFGLPRVAWLETRHLAVPALIILATWRWTGINVIYFTTGLSNIPSDLYEAAEIDGASALQRFWYLSVPLCKPIILFVVVLTLFGGFQLFVEPFILWSGGAGPGGGGMTVVLYLYRTAFTSFRLGYASAIGVVLAVIIMAISLLQLKLFGFFDKS
jgi:arabinosaccharide transport system permease protein